MRDQQNPSTPELHQPLLFAPSELLACGLRNAHHHPLVGIRTDDGVRSWRTSPATAWEHPLVEWARTATSYCSIVLDCDSRESQELACAVEAGYGDLPRPRVRHHQVWLGAPSRRRSTCSGFVASPHIRRCFPSVQMSPTRDGILRRLRDVVRVRLAGRCRQRQYVVEREDVQVVQP